MVTNSYRSELVAARIAIEMIIEYRCKWRMLGVPIVGMSLLYGDDITVITDASHSGSNVKKKYHAYAYHFMREESTAGIVNFIERQLKQNRAYALT